MKTGNTLATGFVSGEFTFRPIQVRTIDIRVDR